ncbi:glycosyltransferase involved in cell wall biosynthesis [Pedobacter sp. CG_S7]|uniref:glycosyltransferase family 2 protein n=1 Tax=Pedobacter sp. CG_S7 TaxID=3143930 RepID=UPI003394BA9C
MINYTVPSWVKEVNLPFKSYFEIPNPIFEDLNAALDRLQSTEPLITIIIAAYNEEVNILRCITSLSKTKCKLPFEILVVNNNSADHTQDTLNRIHVRQLFQPIQGCGPARQMAQENAKGKFILLADSDCLYPPEWMDEMMKVLQQPGVACVYGRYSFIPEPGYARWQLYMLEKMKDAIAGVRHLKRAYLNAFGISMGYVKAYGLKAGYIMHNTRGDDGRLAFDMMKYGSIEQVKSNNARPWTSPRTLDRDGSFYKAITNRITREAGRFFTLLKSEKPHDTKKSAN